LKITQIQIENFLGIEVLTLPLTAPINLLIGENEAGKSSVRDALQWALTGTARGLKTHQEQAALIRNGAKGAEVTITLADGATIIRRKTPKSPATVTGEVPEGTLSPLILCDPFTFLSWPEDQRRELLFKVLPGLDPNGAEIVGGLAEMIGQPVPDLETAKAVNRLAAVAHKQGFPAAEKEAVAMRREAKRGKESFASLTQPGGRATIGEREYILPDVNSGTVEAALRGLQGERDALVKEQGKQEAQAAAAKKRQAAIAQMEADLKTAQDNPPEEPGEGLIEKWEGFVAADRKILDECQEALKAATGNAPEIFPATCPAIKLEAAPCPRAGESIGGQAPDPAKLEKLRQNVEDAGADLLKTKESLAMVQITVTEWDNWQAKITKLQADLSKLRTDTAQDAAAGEDLADKITALDVRLAVGNELLNKVKTFWALKEAYDNAQGKAGEADREVALYDALAKALAPDGLPSRLIAEALAPVNDLLALAGGHLFPGRTLALTKDLEVQLEGCPFTTLSKSARFRVGVAFQFALAKLAGARLLMIDESDILDLPNRSQLIDFLLAIREDFDITLVFATSDHAAPSPVPEIAVWWMEAGQVSAVVEERRAA